MPLILQFSLLWSRIAFGLYVAAVVAVAAAVGVRRPTWFAAARAALGVGLVLQGVALAEVTAAARAWPIAVYPQAISLLGWIVGLGFLLVYRIYSPRALALLVTPLVAVLEGVGAFTPMQPSGSPAEVALLRNGWILVHVVLVALGYACLLLAVASGLLYLAAERQLKAKSAHGAVRLLPPLDTLDRIGYRSLLIGFPLLTLGLLIGLYWADALFGGMRLTDPTVLLAVLAWCIYLVLLLARWSAGWRGRRSAWLLLACLALAVAGWLTNGLSGMHSLLFR